MIEVTAHSGQQSPARRLSHSKAQVAGAAHQLHQGVGVEALGIQQVLLLLVDFGQPGAVDQPIGKRCRALPALAWASKITMNSKASWRLILPMLLLASLL